MADCSKVVPNMVDWSKVLLATLTVCFTLLVGFRMGTISQAKHGSVRIDIDIGSDTKIVFQHMTVSTITPMNNSVRSTHEPVEVKRREKSESSLEIVSNPELDHIAVVMIGGKNRTAWAQAAHDTWLRQFSKRMYVTDVDAEESILGFDLAAITVNVYHDFPSEQSQFDNFIHEKHPFRKHIGHQRAGNTHNLGWHLAQPRYLLGLHALVQRFPNAEWYFIADADTYVHGLRLKRGLLDAYPALERPVALGTQFQRRAGAKMESCLLGGAGTVISAAGIQAVDLGKCVDFQVKDPQWNKLGADWRIAKCLTHDEANVEIKAVDFMWMVDQNFECGQHGPSDCASFYSRIHRHKTKCPYTLHYVTPESVRFMFQTAQRETSVCIPQDFGECQCS
eukprot:m.56322 g.56322  ORF g.56322 m.56322 type:complete len:393 (-) comp11032_c0_seq1:954-2132(-)